MNVQPRLMVMPAVETGQLRAIANFQDPVLEVTANGNEAPTLTIREGGAIIELKFPDTSAIERFQHRVARVCVPAERRRD